MGLKKNITYSTLLTLSTYLVPLLVFPYISRILGPEGIGAIDAVEYVINYAIICSMMGLTTLGIREIARNQNNPEQLNRTFTDLFSLNVLSTLTIFILLVCCVFTIPEFTQRKSFFFIGLIKLLANLFWIEWFFKGMEQFKYITIRSLVFRGIFVLSVFLFVNHSSDSLLYYSFWVGLTVANAICNWNHRRRFASLQFRTVNIKRFFKPFILLGLFALLSAIYTQLNVTYLSFVADDEQVGYYTTSIRLYTVLIALFSTITGVMIPRVSVLMQERKSEEMRRLVHRTFILLFCFAFPVVIFMEVYAPDIISIFAGSHFLPAVTPMRVVMLLVFIIGSEQIFILQLLIPAQKEKAMLYCVSFGCLSCILINILFTHKLLCLGSALAWIGAEIAVLISSSYFVKKYLMIQFPLHLFLRVLTYSLPLAGIAILIACCIETPLLRLALAGLIFAPYAFIMADKLLVLGLTEKTIGLFKKNHC